MTENEPSENDTSALDVKTLLDALTQAERHLATARAEFERLRNAVDSAGELALVDALECAQREFDRAWTLLEGLFGPNSDVDAA